MALFISNYLPEKYEDIIQHFSSLFSKNVVFNEFDKKCDNILTNTCFLCLKPIYSYKDEIEVLHKTDMSSKKIYFHKKHFS
jgi:hypothetical protein